MIGDNRNIRSFPSLPPEMGESSTMGQALDQSPSSSHGHDPEVCYCLKGPVRDCPICLEPLDKGRSLFTTECGHRFHFSCIQVCAASLLPCSSRLFLCFAACRLVLLFLTLARLHLLMLHPRTYCICVGYLPFSLPSSNPRVCMPCCCSPRLSRSDQSAPLPIMRSAAPVVRRSASRSSRMLML